MTLNLLTAGLAGAALVMSAAQAAAAPAAPEDVPLATPAGVTLQSQAPQPPMLPLEIVVRTPARFGDAQGMSAYTYDADTQPGKSLCVAECAKKFPPLPAPAGAQPVGEWTIVSREDGARQWAFRGKPLHTSTLDARWGDMKGHRADNAWTLAVPDWTGGAALPLGIGQQEIAQAPGVGLVTAKGRSVYVFDGDVAKDRLPCLAAGTCEEGFVPLPAPQAGRLAAGGAFTILDRPDGIRQWAFRGKPLYSFQGDLEIGDLNGKGVDPRYRPALLVRYPMPAEVALAVDSRTGGRLTTADGLTLYARDRIRYPASGAHHARGGAPGKVDVGMAISTGGCLEGEAECLTYQPLAAPADAQATGYWTVLTRPDRSRQWAYQGYALYAFPGDRRPGDTAGAQAYRPIVNVSAAPAAPAAYDRGLYWRIAVP